MNVSLKLFVQVKCGCQKILKIRTVKVTIVCDDQQVIYSIESLMSYLVLKSENVIYTDMRKAFGKINITISLAKPDILHYL